MSEVKRVIVISAVNQVDGGTLKIVEDFLDYIDCNLQSPDDLYIALVHSNIKRKLESRYKNILFKGFEAPKKSWLFRIFFENAYCYFFSKKHGVTHWVSLHDLTPRLPLYVQSCVYCHNPSPFHQLKWIDALNLKFVLFVLFYKYAYWLNIKRNKFVVVQQDWLKEYFNREYQLNNVHVVPPKITDVENFSSKKTTKNINVNPPNYRLEELNFIYPCLPRTYKNIEILIKAFKKLHSQSAVNITCKLILTVGKKENLYTRYLAFLAGQSKNITFAGRLPHKEIIDHLSSGTVLLFPSRLETWGLPLSEARFVNAEILAADLQYAHETLSNYYKADFFDVDDVEALTKLISVRTIKGSKFSDSVKREEFLELDRQTSSELCWQEYILNELMD